MPELEVEVHIKVRVHEKDIPKVLKYAHEMGYDYGDDPGKKEIIRRLIVSDGVSVMDEIDVGNSFTYSFLKN
jgi:hypothetical protein